MKPIKISPKCKQGWPHYISAEGQWFPCWFTSHFHRYWKRDFFVVNKEKFDITKRRIEDILSDPILRELEKKWVSGDPEKIPYKCQKFCGDNIEKG
ncbi:MAG: hypothetical protein OXJ52_07570 [Oligoflexia bacterium]|nr:hypothetical protein [Oligoflexia bacterium]